MIVGNLAELSLPEVFRFLEYQQGTGLLSIYAPAGDPAGQSKVNYIWLYRGRIVAFANRLDGQNLVEQISQRGWHLSPEFLQIVRRCSCFSGITLGVCLKNQRALKKEDLKLLFYVGVLQPVCSLFKLNQGKFVFDTKADCPKQEMTGLCMSAIEATLLGLRVLRDWTSLADKLPLPTSVLSHTIADKPHLKLDSQEWEVWQLVDGKRSVQAIAEHLCLSLERVQRIACRLELVGLLEQASAIVPNTMPIPQLR